MTGIECTWDDQHKLWRKSIDYTNEELPFDLVGLKKVERQEILWEILRHFYGAFATDWKRFQTVPKVP